jgi:hypothetical protein
VKAQDEGEPFDPRARAGRMLRAGAEGDRVTRPQAPDPGARYGSGVSTDASVRRASLPIITTDEVRREVHRLFDAGPATGLVIRVHGGEDVAGSADETFREMLASLRMYDDRYRTGGEVLVQAPSKESLVRAMVIIGREEHQKQILNQVLTTFGRHLIDPLTDLLDATPEGMLVSRLSMMRDIFLAQIVDLRLTLESQQILSGDLRALFSDEYLAMVAENEERVQRPRVARLAQRILRLIATTFRRALARWPDHAERIAASIVRRTQGEIRIGDLPALLRTQITDGVEEFLWVETSNDIEGSLRALFAEHRAAVPIEPAPPARAAYREFAAACWEIIAEHC